VKNGPIVTLIVSGLLFVCCGSQAAAQEGRGIPEKVSLLVEAAQRDDLREMIRESSGKPSYKDRIKEALVDKRRIQAKLCQKESARERARKVIRERCVAKIRDREVKQKVEGLKNHSGIASGNINRAASVGAVRDTNSIIAKP